MDAASYAGSVTVEPKNTTYVSEMSLDTSHPNYDQYAQAVEHSLVQQSHFPSRPMSIAQQERITRFIIALSEPYGVSVFSSTSRNESNEPFVGIVVFSGRREGIAVRFNADNDIFAGCLTIESAADQIYALIQRAHEAFGD